MELNAVFKVQEDCCYEKVVYIGQPVIIRRFDKSNEVVGPLLCHCDPKLTIVPI
jgi:hypothetical protein